MKGSDYTNYIKRHSIHILLFIIFFALATIASTKDIKAETDFKSVYGTVNAISTVETETILSLIQQDSIVHYSVPADLLVSFQGKFSVASKIPIGTSLILNYNENSVVSIVITSLPVQPKVKSSNSIYGIFYTLYGNKLCIALPGGTLKNYTVSASTRFFVNYKETNYNNFFRLTLPGDDVQLSFDENNEISKVECWIMKDNQIGKSNPYLFNSVKK